MEGCPDEADLAEFVRAELSSSEAERVEGHLDGCDSCSEVVASLVRIFTDSLVASDQGLPTLEGARTERSVDGDEDEEDDDRALPSGAEVGRYRVLECIGIGGMGVVYSAYDPQLDRRVALKVLRGGAGGADETRRNARLLREAKVMAKLSHPNVIVVHDVGSFDGRVFLAMEFVDGTTLSRWRKAKDRNWKEVRDTFMAAGRGLAAAHDAGLVHRDFKPDNVLIGDDGRVRVTDFGLARNRDESIEASVQASGGSVAQPGVLVEGIDAFATLTKTGVLVGTPAYMAPEQYGGQGVSGATDQFSFCVALYEALYGERPFPGRTLAELATNVCLGKRRPLGDARVPSRVRDAVLRGLRVDPAERFSSMEELLTVLGRQPTRTVQRWAILGVPTAVAAVSVWWAAQPAEAGPSLCRPESKIEAVWDQPARSRLEGAFASESGATALEVLDGYAQRWSAAREELCRTREHDTVDVAQGHCLARARSRFAGLLDVLGQKSAIEVEGVLRAAQALPAPEPCTSDTLVAANLVPLPALHLEEEVSEARAELDLIRALSQAGTVTETLEALDAATEAYQGLDDDPFQAELRFLQGYVWFSAGRYRDARKALEDAAMMGVSSHHRSVAAEAWARLVFMETNVFENTEAAHRAVRMGRAELEALGNPPRILNVLRAHEAGLAIKEARYDEALATYRELLSLGNNQPPLRRADILINLVNVHVELGAWDDALAAGQEYIDIYTEMFGARHSNLVNAHYNIGYVNYASGRFEEALEPLERSIELARDVLPPNHPELGSSYTARCRVFEALERFGEASVACGAALETLSASGQLSGPQLAEIRLSLAEVSVKAGELDSAEALLAEVDAAAAGFSEPDVEGAGRLLSVRGTLAMARENPAKAQEFLERAIDMFKTSGSSPEVRGSQARLELAAVVAARGDTRYAIELLDDVLATTRLDGRRLRAKARTMRERL